MRGPIPIPRWCCAASLIALPFLAMPGTPVVAAPVRAACSAVGTYTVLPQGWQLVVNGPVPGLFPTVTGGRATISRYTGCGAQTVLTISTQGAGALLRHPVTPFIGNQLRAAGDVLLQFNGTAHQDPLARADPHAVRLSGTAVYVHVTTRGAIHGKRLLSYGTRTVQVTNVPVTLKVTTDLTGALSLSCALPGPRVGKLQSSFTYFAVGVRNPSRINGHTAPSKNL